MSENNNELGSFSLVSSSILVGAAVAFDGLNLAKRLEIHL
jgi:hypothetical protein